MLNSTPLCTFIEEPMHSPYRKGLGKTQPHGFADVGVVAQIQVHDHNLSKSDKKKSTKKHYSESLNANPILKPLSSIKVWQPLQITKQPHETQKKKQPRGVKNNNQHDDSCMQHTRGHSSNAAKANNPVSDTRPFIVDPSMSNRSELQRPSAATHARSPVV